ncbi:MAG: ATP-binding protein [Planctomycetota bacterium]|nr:ATP-binding protein [Planctomycetota bacterium]
MSAAPAREERGGRAPASRRRTARSFRTEILLVVLTSSVLGISLTAASSWHYARLRRIEESGQASVRAVERSQARVSRSTSVVLNALDIFQLPDTAGVTSYHLDALLMSQDFLRRELQESIAEGGLVSALENAAPSARELIGSAEAHLLLLERIDALIGRILLIDRQASEQGSDAVDGEQARALADELVAAMEDSEVAAADLSRGLATLMARRKSRQVTLAGLTFALYAFLVLYLLLWCARSIAGPVERLENAVVRASEGHQVDFDFTSFREVDSLKDALLSLIAAHDARESDLAQRVRDKVGELRRREQEIHHLQRIEQLGQFAGSIAHDFRNLLTVIVGYAELIELSSPDEGTLSRNISEVLLASQRATELTEKLLAFSRHEPEIGSGPLVVQDWFDECVVLLSPFAGVEAGVLQLECEPGLPDLLLPRISLDQIVLNLVSNARDSLPVEGGCVRVRIAAHDESVHGRVSPRLASADSVTVLQVSDDGPGIPEAAQSRIFEPYFTTKGRGRGTGFGLSIVREIVERAEGEISLRSDPGGETTFLVFLPGHPPVESGA